MEAHRQIVQVSGTHLSLDLPPALRDRRLEVIVLLAVDEAPSAEGEPVVDEQAIARIFAETQGAWGRSDSTETVANWIEAQRRQDWPED
ncbi:hypothetical protein [Synechococcus elongatus]|uniref:ANL33 n=1 Tax=Synechococcus elongatus (strain ATCC 33912 / PCC 7942 / FACHB-805) TaxID=1140 RepID=Q8KUU7_SYNE7|nr:hypothetical protein [Synechococcus elongatus]AAM81161.1 ANL33 [Synechococcus elongatus PCC 7942 = FACHB-805]ABB58677.1 hypothetical protein Synpcc7942_B2648 [Synechococcus elongatus PCC 7942 = FACHB-805]AJD58973.1 hypothetical protein M744_14095 [Synechococcus elongatus UTEX 2973]MBD2589062.1 hypothetical protein [Synechococcus elongatus FACHB-242]MBD2690117.1 hypothetical protein [Synechococcus elongatus FACHB-1061]